MRNPGAHGERTRPRASVSPVPRPRNRELLDSLREQILRGQLPPGARLASSRQLAAELGVSRNTVLYAYEQLVAEGYARARTGAGTFVADFHHGPPETTIPTATATSQRSRLSHHLERMPAGLLQRSASHDVRINFLYGEPAYHELPLRQWSRLVGRRARHTDAGMLGYPPLLGQDVLRQAIAAYLGRSRGVICSPEQVIVVHGTQEAIDLTVKAFVDEGSPVVLEDPHYRGFRKSLLAANADIRFARCDGDGLLVSELSHTREARMICVTPSHQFPSGGVLPLERRLALLRWAEAAGAMILEDDYDGEFRYGQKTIAPLQSLDQSGRVMYVGTASKVLFPALRLGWLVVAEDLVPAMARLKSLADSTPATLEQLAFADFINEGYLERHVHQMRHRFAAKRAHLVDQMQRHFGHHVRLAGDAAGLHILASFDAIPASAGETIVAKVRELGTGVYLSASYYATPPACLELLLGYAALEEADIARGVAALSQALADYL